MSWNIYEQLEKQYKNIFYKYDLLYPVNMGNITIIIKKMIIDFLSDTTNPAIYCNGGHTKMLMSDFMYELKKIKIIVDNYIKNENDGGFIYIEDSDIEKYNIDAIIISSYRYRNDIRERLNKFHSNIKVLDIYEELEKRGIILQADYYFCNHPYHQYAVINNIQNQIKKECNMKTKEKLYIDLITHYLQIKDLRTASMKSEELYNIIKNEKYLNLTEDIKEIYKLELEACNNISKNHVLMMCFDGLRRRDLSAKYMPKLYKYLVKNAYVFTNAYSCSTSTYESLVPAYSGNDNLKTKYYENNSVDEKDCKFLQLAKIQKRKVHVYGDVFHYIDGVDVKHEDVYQTATEKIWSFIRDASLEKCGLYYIHELYESHFSFSNPYTDNELISEGTALLFDFLPLKGGKLRTDYKQQHTDALRYLDDVVSPFIENTKCNMVIYADHGNLIMDKNCSMCDVCDLDYTCSEQWIQIPLVIKSDTQKVGSDNMLISLKSISDIIVALLKNIEYKPEDKKNIKIMRSALYNPDFKFLYKKVDKERYLKAFEAFIFNDNYKLVIYSDKYVELYKLPDESKITNENIINKLKNNILSEISVYDS